MNQQQNQDPFGSIPISNNPNQSQESPPSLTSPSRNKPTFSRKKTPPKKKSSRRFYLLKLLLLALLIVIATYLLAGYYLLPYIITSYGANKLAELSGRSVTISKAEFNPISLDLKIGNSVIGPDSTNPEDTIDPLLSFSKLVVDIDPQSILKKGLVFQKLELSQLYAHVKKNSDKSTNVSFLLDSLFAKSSNNKGLLAKSAAYLKENYSLNNISIKRSEIVFEDETTNKKHHINNLNLGLPTLATLTYKIPQIEPHFSATINGSPVTLEESMKKSSGSSIIQLSLHMKDVDVMSYVNYLPSPINKTIKRGLADMNINVSYDPQSSNTGEQLGISGTIAVNNVLFGNSFDKSTIESMKIDGTYFPLSKSFFLKHLIFSKPKISVKRSLSGLLTFSPPFDLLSQSNLFSDNAAPTVSHFEITHGQLLIHNEGSSQKTQPWTDLSVDVTPKSLEAPMASDFEFSAKKGKRSSIRLFGKIDKAPYLAKGLFEGKNLDIGTISSLSKWFAGSMITKAEATHIKSNFTYGGQPGKTTFTLDNLLIKANNIEINNNGTPLAVIKKWHSENGFFFTSSDPTIHLGSVQMSDSSFNFTRKNDVKNWDSILGDHPLLKHNNEAIKASLSSLELIDSSVIFNTTDDGKKPHKLSKLMISAPQIKEATSNLYTASAQVNNSSIKASGAFSLTPFSVNGNISAEDIPTDFLETLLFPSSKTFPKGTIRFDGSYQIPSFEFKGAMTASNISLEKSDYTFKSKLCSSPAIWVKSDPALFSLGQLSLEKPEISLSLKKKGPSLFSILDTLSPASKQSASRVKLDALFIRDGILSVNNRLMNLSIQRLNGSYTKATDMKLKDFIFRGQLDGISPIHIEGTSLANNPVKMLNASYEIKKYPALKKSPFLEPFLGYSINKGRFDLTGTLQINNNQLNQSLGLIVSGLELGSPTVAKKRKVKGDTWKSTPLLQALQQNAQDYFTLSFTTSNAVFDHNFSFGREIFKEYKKMLLKARVSPFSFLSSNAEAVPVASTVSFAPGSSKLAEPDKKQLSNLVNQLNNRPLLRLTVSGYADTKIDKKALIDERIEEINKRQRQHDAKLSQALSSSYGKEIIDQPFGTDYQINSIPPERAKKNIRIPLETLKEIASNRIQTVIKFMEEQGMSNTRISKDKTEVIDSGHLGRKGNRIDLELEI